MPNTPQFSLSLVQAAQAQKHVTVNEALTRIDAALQLSVLDSTITTPPATPEEGDCYLVPFGATGDWDGRYNDIAIYIAGGWEFFRPGVGWRLHNVAGGADMRWDGVTWLSGDVDFSLNGAATVGRVLELDHVLDSGATSTVADAIPINTFVMGVSARVTSAITGGVSGWSLGVSGATTRYGSGYGVGLNSSASGLDTRFRRYDSSTDLILTAESGSFTSGSVRLAVHLFYLVPPRP